MKNENAIMDRIKARIAYHANEHRHTYEIGKGVMDFLARDLLTDFKAAGGLFPPVALDGDVYVIYRRKRHDVRRLRSDRRRYSVLKIDWGKAVKIHGQTQRKQSQNKGHGNPSEP